jgi:hypothetical protein
LSPFKTTSPSLSKKSSPGTNSRCVTKADIENLRMVR